MSTAIVNDVKMRVRKTSSTWYNVYVPEHFVTSFASFDGTCYAYLGKVSESLAKEKGIIIREFPEEVVFASSSLAECLAFIELKGRGILDEEV